jgi:hypothetical protein
MTPDELMVAIAGVPLLQLPPEVVLLSVIIEPTQTAVGPVIVPALGVEVTVIDCVSATLPHVLLMVYEIIVVPTAIGIIVPVEVTLAMPGTVLDHVPPVVASVKVEDEPIQILLTPTIVPALGCGFTNIVLSTEVVPHVLVDVYLIVSSPVVKPVTTPVELTVAIDKNTLLHTPVVAVSVNVVDEPWQTESAPVIALTTGVELTVTLILVYRVVMPSNI